MTFPTLSAPGTQALLLVLLCVGSFAAGLPGGFVLDDNRAILRHPVVSGTAPTADAFKLTYWGESLATDPLSFRPLATLSFALDHRLFGASAMAFHVSSLLWYIGLVLVGWVFARRCMPPRAALLAMAIFVVMPVHVENVSSLVGRADTLAVLLSLLALLALSPGFVDGEPPSALRVALAASAFAGALLCKESVAVLPVIAALFVEYRRRGAAVKLSVLRAHLSSLILLACLGIYIVLRLRLQPSAFAYTADDDVLVGASLWETAGYGLELLARYARLVVVPTALCTGRKYAEVFRPAHLSLRMIAGVCLVAVVALVSWRDARKGRLPFVLAAFLAWLAVTGIFFAIPESMADRFLLLPSLFLSCSLGQVLLSSWNGGGVRRAALLIALALQVVLSNRQAETWHDSGTLWSHANLVCPDSAHDHFRYAEYLSEQGQPAEAVWHYAVFTAARHAFPYAWSNPALEEERSMPAEQRLSEMHRLLRVGLDERQWRSRFATYLLSLGRRREAMLVVETGPRD